jgi:hypothetical protein
MYQDAVATEDNMEKANEGAGSQATFKLTKHSDDLTRSFVRLTNLPTYPLDRLSRYEATLWRQACQILFTLRCLDRRKPWERLRLR